jgi:transcriptional regulator with XRE-family HTH domain
VKLPKKHKALNPAIARVAETIRAAMTERRLDVRVLTEMLGLEKSQRGAVAHWAVGKNGPGAQIRPKLAEILGLTEDQLTANTRRGRPGNFKPLTGEAALGPAQRAVALVATKAPELLPGPPPVQDVFVIRARSDGTMQIRLDASLPYAKGTQLVQFLLNFGLVIGADAAE